MIRQDLLKTTANQYLLPLTEAGRISNTLTGVGRDSVPFSLFKGAGDDGVSDRGATPQG
jgi:hypothetical protein